jgi:trans-AT polyketide synthase/acyltransferase/oxidoreductase domain-containing protein
LGDPEFLRVHGVSLAIVQGAMVGGIASSTMVIRMGKAGLLGFWGAGGLPMDAVERALLEIKGALKANEPWGMNLLHNMYHPEVEDRTVDLYLKHGVTRVEAAAYMMLTPAVVRFGVKGLTRGAGGRIVRPHRIFAKLSRLEVAVQFMAPAPEKILGKLLTEGKITPQEAELARLIPVAEDVTVEADSGGHTDNGVAYTLTPAFMRLRDELAQKHGYAREGVRVRIGAAGGLGTPQAVAAAFVLGADYVVTGSINQCTLEAGTSDLAKDLLQQASFADTDMAPAGDMFELGVQVQVLRKGVFFPMRARKLFELYKRYAAWGEIPESERAALEKTVLRTGFDELWGQVKAYWEKTDPAQIAKAENDGKHLMALCFRWYLGMSTRWAIQGEADRRMDFQIHAGPAIGACNEWLRGTQFEPWKARHADELAMRLMEGAGEVLSQRFAAFAG